jgi:1-acyl-sn-glycerol-3-phosphate acyltransferase
MKPLISNHPASRFLTFLFYECIVLPLLWIYDHLVFGLSVRGRKYIRSLRGRGAVLVCNHVNTLDCTFVGLLAAPRKIIYTAVAWLFRWRFIGPLIHILGAVPVPFPPCTAADTHRFIREMTKAVQKGRLVCIYPEGEMFPYGNSLHEFRNGAFLIAAHANAPVVPISIIQRERKGLWKILKHKHPCLTISAASPIYPLPLGTPGRTANDLRLRVRAAMDEMLEGSVSFGQTA